MHPPLDRPHPKCQSEIHALKVCHAQDYSKILFWRCNEIKRQLDLCFKEEKKEMLKNLNQNEDQIRQKEDRVVLGKTESYEEFLKRDEEYQRLRKERK